MSDYVCRQCADKNKTYFAEFQCVTCEDVNETIDLRQADSADDFCMYVMCS